MTNAEKGKLYDDYIFESDKLQRINSKLKSEFPIEMPEDKQKIITENNAKIDILVQKLNNLYR